MWAGLDKSVPAHSGAEPSLSIPVCPGSVPHELERPLWPQGSTGVKDWENPLTLIQINL